MGKRYVLRTQIISQLNNNKIMEKENVDYTATSGSEVEEVKKEYTPVRRVYAVIGFISIICSIGIVLYSLVMGINYINHNIDEYVPPSSLLGEIEELKEVVAMQKMVIGKAEEVIEEQKVLLFLKDEKIDEQFVVLKDQDSVIADQSALLKRQDTLLKEQRLFIDEYIEGI